MQPPSRIEENENQHDFIAWDGEGINLSGAGHPQSYILFGSNLGAITSREGISTYAILDYIIETGRKQPRAIHVGFAFTYDANMIVQSLAPSTLGRLHKNGWVKLRRKDGRQYTITFARGKFFRVTRYEASYDAKRNPKAKHSVQIFDVFSFFACSFIKAYEDMIGSVPNIIRTGKAARGGFILDDFDEVRQYWEVEIKLLAELAEELRRRVYNAGLRITQWHGPGALSSYAMRQHNIKAHMADTGPEVRLAARYAYMAGRFELFKVGRIVGRIYGVDKNSAYPTAIAELPSLVEGQWTYVREPERVSRFGVYHVTMNHFAPMAKQPSPLFHRDKNHNITFPWMVDGWYWSPEAHLAQQRGGVLVEGWEYRGARTKPFTWIKDMFETRRDWKARNISAQVALKLCMNAAYGKLAQRIGWDEVKRRIPPFHQLEWAGYVTSHTRASMYQVLSRIPYDQLISIETDGIYTTVPPENLGITVGSGLGEWTVSEYQEIMYVQSGLAWLRDSQDQWETKRRGLDPCREGHAPRDCDCPGTFSLSACEQYLQQLQGGDQSSWVSYTGQTTRFVGLGQALASKGLVHDRLCVWETVPRVISPGLQGKRVHSPKLCHACRDGLSAYDAAHDLVINSRAVVEPQSYPHSIPWEPEIGHAEWRDYVDVHS